MSTANMTSPTASSKPLTPVKPSMGAVFDIGTVDDLLPFQTAWRPSETLTRRLLS